MQRTAARATAQADLGGMILIDAQQQRKKRWIMKDGLAHNELVSTVSETRDSSLKGLLVKLFEGAQPETLSYSAQNRPQRHQTSCTRSVGFLSGYRTWTAAMWQLVALLPMSSNVEKSRL